MFVTQKNISSFYVSKALNAYSESKRSIYNELMEKRERMISRRQLETSVQHTPVEKANHFREYIVSLYHGYKSGGYFYDIGDFAYNWLKKTGQLNLAKDEIDAAVKYGKDSFRRLKQADAGSAAALLRSSLQKENQEQAEKRLAREYILMKYFDDKTIPEIIEKINIRDFLDDEK